jgi:cytosine/adenosine deaminase-related metal-dependent hydrolase
VIRTDAVNTAPVHDPFATVVTQAHPGNIDTVLVAGRTVKSGGRLTADWKAVHQRLEKSKEYVTDAVSGRGGFFPQPPLDLPW